MRKAPLNIVMVVILLVIAILFLLSWLVFPVYTVTTEGRFDLSGEGPQGEFTVTEEYYLNHYQASSDTHPMFDTNNDGVPDSQESPEYSYSDEPDLGDGKTSNNYGWGGSVEDGGQPAKARIYNYTFYAMVASLIFAGLMIVIIPLSGSRVSPMVLANLLGFLLILSCMFFPMIPGMVLPGAYKEDDRDHFDARYSDTGLSYKTTDVGDTYMGEITSHSAGGKDYTYYTDPGQELPSPASTEDTFIMDEDPAGRHWTTNFGAQTAAGYSHSEGGAITDSNTTYVSVYLTKIRYGPGFGWYLSVLTIFISIFGWIFSIVITGVTAASLKKPPEEESSKKQKDKPAEVKLVEPVVVQEEKEEEPAVVQEGAPEEKAEDVVNMQCPSCDHNFPQDKNSKTIKCPKCGITGELE